MTNKYNFDEIADSEKPLFKMGGEVFQLRYPTVEEVEKIQQIESTKEQEEVIYQFIDKTKEDQKPFKEILRKQDIRVLKAFIDMIKKEFGVEEE